MKKLFLLPLIALFAFAFSENKTLEKKERKYAANSLKQTSKDLMKAVKGLSDAQLKFKASADKWSVEDCMKHLAMAEMGLKQMIDANLKQPANPEKRSEIKITDEGLVTMIKDRSNKVKTNEAMQPENTPFKSMDEAITSFKDNREKLIDYVKNTQDDLRSHVIDFPIGKMDAYQMVLLISVHTNRHMQQMQEVMADPNFPKQ